MNIYLYLLIIPLLIIIITILFMIKNRTISKMSFKNIFRRKVDAFLLILGSMIGTAFIIGAMGLNDSFSNFVYQNINRYFGEIDEVMYAMEGIGIDYESVKPFLNELKKEKIIDGEMPLYFKTFPAAKKGNLKSLNVSQIKQLSFIGADFSNFENFGSVKIKIPDMIKNLSGNETVITDDAAKEFGLKIGDEIEVLSGANALTFLLPPKVKIIGIINEKGLLNYRGREGGGGSGSAFISFEQGKKFARFDNDNYNEIWISNTGDVLSGDKLTPKIKELSEKFNLDKLKIKINYSKSTQIEAANGGQTAVAFLLLSIFAVAAGCVLIINMYQMLADERRSELGTLRAIGFTKSWIRRTMYFESFFYSIFSAPIGVLSGIFISQYTFSQVNQLSSAFGQWGGSGRMLPTSASYHIETSSIVIGTLIGIILPLLITYFFTLRIGNLNIVNAIRNIPDNEDQHKKRSKILISLFCIFGLLTVINTPLYIKYLGVSIMVLILPYILFKDPKDWVPSVASITVLLISLFWGGTSGWLLGFKSVIVLISVIILGVYNFKIIEWFMIFLFNKSIKFKPILKIALSYPMRNKKRTGVIVTLYGMVIFIIVIFRILPFIQNEAIQKNRDLIFGGFDGVMVQLPFSKPLDINEFRKNDNLRSVGEFYFTTGTTQKGKVIPLIFSSRELLGSSKFEMIEKIPELKNLSEKEVWEKISTTPGWAVISKNFSDPSLGFGYKVGDIVKVKLNKSTFDFSGKPDFDPTKTDFTFRIVAQLSGASNLAADGPIMSSERKDIAVIKKTGGTSGIVFALNNKKADVLNKFKLEVKTKNIFTLFVDEIVGLATKATESIVNIFLTFLYFGLFVGILGIAITTIKSIKERRNVIGMLKAIGYTKMMIFWTFFIETSFVILLGILIGFISGIITSYEIYKVLFIDIKIDFTIPWDQLIIMGLIFYIMSIIFTFFPSWSASKISAADAMRYYE